MNDDNEKFLWRKFYDCDAKINKDGTLNFIVNHNTGQKLFPFCGDKNVSGEVDYNLFRARYRFGKYKLRSLY